MDWRLKWRLAWHMRSLAIDTDWAIVNATSVYENAVMVFDSFAL